ncbi:hypothetical protein BpHYR1_032345 [Brachionus plicatilis]|uniref:Uncharacterized protein n=1 Tax=Brachionus plicatilis TaxID=10195 RepID=A0A3M7Q4W9_BRAPC|nr:hypothetical protein BpHYR1_032345 [Brachionus plicatilis]
MIHWYLSELLNLFRIQIENSRVEKFATKFDPKIRHLKCFTCYLIFSRYSYLVFKLNILEGLYKNSKYLKKAINFLNLTGKSKFMIKFFDLNKKIENYMNFYLNFRKKILQESIIDQLEKKDLF